MNELPHVYPSVAHMLIAAADKAPQHEALVQGEQQLNYQEYLRCAIGFARELQELGASGERVGLLMGNSINICIAMFAIHMARAQAMPLNPIYTEQELHSMLQDAEVSLPIYDEVVAENAERLAGDLSISHRICCGGDQGRDTR